MHSTGWVFYTGLLLTLLAWPGRLFSHGVVEHRKPLPHISVAQAGPWMFTLESRVLRKDEEGWITVQITDKKTKQPLTGAQVFIIVPHQHAQDKAELEAVFARYGTFDDPGHNRELLVQNIGETGSAIAEESPPGSYAIPFTPIFAAWHEVHVLVLAVGGHPLPERVEALLTVNVAKPIVRISMQELHKYGGIPPGWQFALPPGDPKVGREVFVKMECYACHEVAGEGFPPPKEDLDKAGLALTGMGAHHPPEYLAESIIDPNAVIVEGQGYTGPDGLSIMPSYSDLLTLQELIDLVAYLTSLHGVKMPSPPEAAPAAHEEGGGHHH